MDAESINKQEQSHNRDNEHLQMDEALGNMKFCKEDSPSDVLSKSAENLTSHVEVASTCIQIGTESHNDKLSCQSDEQISQSLNKPMKVDIGSKAADTAEIKIDVADGKSTSALVLSDDYLSQMMKNVNDREMAIYVGAFLISDEKEHSDYADKQSLQPVKEALIIDVSKKADNSIKLDKIEMVVENSDDRTEKLDQKEKTTTIDNALVQKVHENECIDENNANKQDLLPAKERFILDKTNSFNDVNETENEFYGKSTDPLESTAADANGKLTSHVKMPLYKIEHIDATKAFSQNKLRNISPTTKEAVLDRMQNMNWLKPPAGVGGIDVNRRKSARKSSMEKGELQLSCKGVKEVKEEFTEEAKSNSKSSRKRSSQSKNRKAKAADSSKQDSTEDQCKKSSSDVQLASIPKNETLKSNVRAVEKSTDSKDSPLNLGSQKSSIGRGRNDRRKTSLAYSQPKGLSDISDQRNKPFRNLQDIPIMEEQSFSKNEANSSAQVYSVEARKVEDFAENKVVTDSTKSKKLEVCEMEMESKLSDEPDRAESLPNPLPIKNTANYNEPSIQMSKDEIYTQKKELPPLKDDYESQNKTDENSSIRPIYGRPTGGNKSEEVLSVQGFGQNTNESMKRNNQPFQSHNLSSGDGWKNPHEQTYKNQNYGKHSENKIHQSFGNQENYATKNDGFDNQSVGNQENYTTKNKGFSNTSHDLPRWNHNSQSDWQGMKSNDSSLQKGFTSNRHRNVTKDENEQSEESFGNNDRYQGSKGYPDKFYDSRASGGRYSERSQDNRNYNYQSSNKTQHYRNYGQRSFSKNQDGRSYSDMVSDKKDFQGDKFFNLNKYNRGFADGFSDGNQDRADAQRYSDKVRDSKASDDRYSDEYQQSKTSTENFSDRSHNGNQMLTKKQEPSCKNPVSFDKYGYSNQTKNQDLSDKHHVYSNKYQDNRNSNNNSPNSTKETFNKTQDSPKKEDTYEQYGRKAQNTSNNFEPNHNEHVDMNTAKQIKSDVKSQKHYDNTQQAKVQKGLNEIQQSYSVPSVAHQPLELSSAVDQKVELQERVTHSSDLTNPQPIQREDRTSYQSTSKQDAIHSTGVRSASPFANVNMALNPTVTTENNMQYNQALFNPSDKFTSVSSAPASQQRLNIVMAFEGNQNVQRALGMDSSDVNQSQPSQANKNDAARSNTSSPAPSPQVHPHANVAQFLQTLPPGLMDSQTALAYSTMNVNAAPFEVPKQSIQESNDQPMYAMQSMASNSQTGISSRRIDGKINAAYLNEISNNSAEYMKLHRDVIELSEQLAHKQSQLVGLQLKLFKAAKIDVEVMLSQPANQHTCNSQLVQQQNQLLPPNYVQAKQSTCPPGFGEVSLNMQNTQTHYYEMLANVANVQNYPVEKSTLNRVSESRTNAQSVYLAQGNVYQQQAVNYQMFTDKTANSASYVSMLPQTAEERQIRSSVIQCPKK